MTTVEIVNIEDEKQKEIERVVRVEKIISEQKTDIDMEIESGNDEFLRCYFNHTIVDEGFYKDRSGELIKIIAENKKKIIDYYHGIALVEHKTKEKIRKSKLINYKSWKRAIKLDQKSGKEFTDNLDSYVSDMIIPSFQTREFKFLVLKLVEGIKYSIHVFEKEGMDL